MRNRIFGKVGFGLSAAAVSMTVAVRQFAAAFYSMIATRKELTLALEAAHRSEQRFRDFAQVASDWYWEMDAELRFTYLSARVTDVLGIKPEEMLGHHRGQICSPDEINHPEKWARHHADLEARRPFRGFEYRVMQGERGERYARISGKPVFDESGAFRGYRGVGTDITAEVESTAALARSEEEFRNLIEGSIQGIRIMSPDWKPLFVNRAYVRIMGHDSPEEILALPSFEQHIAPYELPRMGEIRRARLEGRPVPDVYEHDAVRKDGSIITLQSSVRRIEWKGKVAIQGTVIDVTDRKRAELALRESERRFRALYDNNPSMYLTLTQEGRIASINRFGADQIGYSIEELVGRELTVLFPDDAVSRLLEQFSRDVGGEAGVHHFEERMLRRDESDLWVRMSARRVGDEEGKSQFLIVCEDVTEAHQLAEQLSYHATHDALTGLVNRREFEQRVARAIAATRGAAVTHALCYIDLDQFKVVNDTCGHDAGDELLRQLTQLLRARIRQRDTLARLGGDEFGLLLEHCALEDAQRVADGVRRAINEFRFAWKEKSFHIGASIGLAPIDGTVEGFASVMSAADAACYVAKEEGRNRVHVHCQEDEVLSRRRSEMQWVARIEDALENQRFELWAQDIAPLREVRAPRLHVELLIRMRDQSGDLVAPGAFLPAAERYHLSSRVDHWVVRHALQRLSARPEFVARLGLCAINLSGHSFGSEEFLNQLLAMLGESKVPPEKICFEVTETVAIANLNRAQRFMKTLAALGCRFSLDDFGSGLCSFGYLRQLPIDHLKIDGQFVRGMVDDPVDRAMVKSITEIGRTLGKKIIAEFVDRADTLDALRSLGVDFAQGYLFARPVPLDEYLAGAHPDRVQPQAEVVPPRLRAVS